MGGDIGACGVLGKNLAAPFQARTIRASKIPLALETIERAVIQT